MTKTTHTATVESYELSNEDIVAALRQVHGIPNDFKFEFTYDGDYYEHYELAGCKFTRLTETKVEE